MRPRRGLSRGSCRLEHNQSHSLFLLLPTLIFRRISGATEKCGQCRETWGVGRAECATTHRDVLSASTPSHMTVRSLSALTSYRLSVSVSTRAGATTGRYALDGSPMN